MTTGPTGVPHRKFLHDGLHEALPHLERTLVREGRGHEFMHLLQGILLQEAGDATLERILAAVKREIAALEEAATAASQEPALTRKETQG
jgi:hypothetical protein